MIITELIGFVLVAYSIKIFWGFKSIDPVGIFHFEDGTNQFKIAFPGYYSISILGAGFIGETEKVVLELSMDAGRTLEVSVNAIGYRFTNQEEKGVAYWGFSTDHVGSCVLTVKNTEHVEAKESMLSSKRMYEKPIDHRKLKILIYQTTPPLYKISAIVSLVVGVNLIIMGIIGS